jgi:hypothetical protein
MLIPKRLKTEPIKPFPEKTTDSEIPATAVGIAIGRSITESIIRFPQKSYLLITHARIKPNTKFRAAAKNEDEKVTLNAAITLSSEIIVNISLKESFAEYKNRALNGIRISRDI